MQLTVNRTYIKLSAEYPSKPVPWRHYRPHIDKRQHDVDPLGPVLTLNYPTDVLFPQIYPKIENNVPNWKNICHYHQTTNKDI